MDSCAQEGCDRPPRWRISNKFGDEYLACFEDFRQTVVYLERSGPLTVQAVPANNSAEGA